MRHPWVQTSESMCPARPQKGKKTTAAGGNCFAVWTRIIRGICVSHLHLGGNSIFPLILLDVLPCCMYPARTSLGLQGAKSTPSSSVQLHSSALYHVSHEQGYHLLLAAHQGQQ